MELSMYLRKKIQHIELIYSLRSLGSCEMVKKLLAEKLPGAVAVAGNFFLPLAP
jgi:hypothetical protein